MNTLNHRLRSCRRLAGAGLLAMTLSLAGLSTAAPAFAHEGHREHGFGDHGYYRGHGDHRYHSYYRGGNHRGERGYYRLPYYRVPWYWHQGGD